MEKKAKSRLNSQQSEKTQIDFSSRADRKKADIKKNILRKYFQHISTLIIAVFLYISVIIFMNIITPSAVEDMLLANTYLPFLILFSLANFFLLSFIFLDSKRGLFYSIGLSLLLFLKFQSVLFTINVILFLFFSILIFEGMLFIRKKLS